MSINVGTIYRIDHEGHCSTAFISNNRTDVNSKLDTLYHNDLLIVVAKYPDDWAEERFVLQILTHRGIRYIDDEYSIVEI